jgi:hypothetical protein
MCCASCTEKANGRFLHLPMTRLKHDTFLQNPTCYCARPCVVQDGEDAKLAQLALFYRSYLRTLLSRSTSPFFNKGCLVLNIVSGIRRLSLESDLANLGALHPRSTPVNWFQSCTTTNSTYQQKSNLTTIEKYSISSIFHSVRRRTDLKQCRSPRFFRFLHVLVIHKRPTAHPQNGRSIMQTAAAIYSVMTKDGTSQLPLCKRRLPRMPATDRFPS